MITFFIVLCNNKKIIPDDEFRYDLFFYLTVNNSVDKTQLDYNEIAKYRNT